MLRNYLTIAWRNLIRHKLYSFINILGLAIGIACCLLAMVYVRHELSYDRFHEKGDRVYRIVHQGVDGHGRVVRSAATPTGYAPHMTNEFPEIVHAVRTWSSWERLKYEDMPLDSGKIVYTDAGFLDLFSFPMIKGNPRTALAEPFSMVLTESAAQQFGDEDPLGKVITFSSGNRQFEFKITGIVQNPPDNSRLSFTYLASFTSLKDRLGKEDALEDYTNYNYSTYLLLPEGYAPADLEAKYPDFIKKYTGQEATYGIWLQPLGDIYLTTDIEYDMGPKGDIRSIYALATIAFFVLVIACINFMNLTTARSLPRAREVGLRKTLGALRLQLIGQFMGESILLSFVTLVLAVALAELFLPLFNEFAGKQLVIDYVGNPSLIAGLLVIGLGVGVVSGSYPALYLSSFSPTSILRGTLTSGKGGAGFRKMLIVVQFAIAIGLIACTGTVWRQFHHMKSQKLGFDKEQVVFMWINDIRDHYDVLKQEVLQNPRVLGVGMAQSLPGRVGTSQGFYWEGGGDNRGQFYTMMADPGCLKILGLELVQGRHFSQDIVTDETHAYILNETLVRELGWDDPVGKEFAVWDREPGRVVGVVRDFHFKSLHQQIEPLAIYMRPAWYSLVVAKISSEEMPATLDFMKEKWNALSADDTFHYTFLDDDFDRLYRSEEKLSRILGALGLLAISVACLGLLGLASFTVERRTKEIGIRKALGASVSHIFLLLAREFTRWVVVANAIAWPLAYFAMQRWLQDFAYRISLGADVFVAGGVFALAMALISVSYQAIKAALANPVNALRYE